MIQIFLADGLTNGLTDGLTKVFHEALADLKIVNNNAHSNIYADAPQRTLVVQCPQHFDRNNDGESLTTKA